MNKEKLLSKKKYIYLNIKVSLSSQTLFLYVKIKLYIIRTTKQTKKKYNFSVYLNS